MASQHTTIALRELRAYLLSRMPRFKAPTDAAAWRKKVPELRRETLEKVFLRGYPRKVVESHPRIELFHWSPG